MADAKRGSGACSIRRPARLGAVDLFTISECRTPGDAGFLASRSDYLGPDLEQCAYSKEQPSNFPLAVMMFGRAWCGPFVEVAPTREQAFAYLPEATKQQVRSWDANDFLYQMRVNDGFDAYRDLDRVKARVLMINMAGDG